MKQKRVKVEDPVLVGEVYAAAEVALKAHHRRSQLLGKKLIQTLAAEFEQRKIKKWVKNGNGYLPSVAWQLAYSRLVALVPTDVAFTMAIESCSIPIEEDGCGHTRKA